ncbi:MAG: SPFH domain-containing protein [Bacteroidetes bacterium]|nr:SPFH domain-containing protein [Bacteroidota bacterium]
MGLFKKNPNEKAFTGGKKNWAEVIKNSGPGALLIWKQPEEDFNTHSTLIVNPGEEAIFINGGVIEQVFDNGTYKLSTKNYPFISRLRNVFTGGISVFNCRVYFVRTALSMEIYWGTDSPIQVRDPKMLIATSVRARGAYKVKIDNGAKFLTKLIGNNINFALQEEINSYFINEFQQHIKASIAKSIKNSNEEILGICAEQDILANKIQPILQEILDAYGLKLTVFSIAAIEIPEDDTNRQKLEEAFANKGVMNILGENWQNQQNVEIMKAAANNEGGLAATGAGLGIGMGMAGMVQNMMNPPQNANPINSNQDNDPVVKLKQLKEMLDMGAITQDDFDLKKQEILKNF